MSSVSHVECPICGAPIGISDLSRIVRCAHCDGQLLVDGHDFVGEYYREPKLDRTAARRKVQRALSRKEMPGGLLRQSRLDSARLYFVPYNEVFARRVGKVVMRSAKKVLGDKGLSRPTNTRVVVSDVKSITPAVSLPDFGLSHAGLKSQEGPLSQEGSLLCELLPTTRNTLAKKGRIYHPTIPPDRVLEELDSSGMSATLETDTEYIERRYRRIFYPVWRIRYRYRKRFYWATIDGVSGATMTLRAPENDRQRLKWLLGTAIFTALVLGKGLRVALAFFNEVETGAAISLVTHPVVLVVALFALGFLALLLSAGWEQFRYSGELVLSGDQVEVVKLNKPPGETRVARFIIKLLDGVSHALQSKEKKL